MSKLETAWYQGKWYKQWSNWLFIPLIPLIPLSLLFWGVSGIRRQLYQLGIKKAGKSRLPVIVVGNISVGGNGKTPFVIWLVEWLQQHQIRAGVISRGYGGKQASRHPLAVTAPYDANLQGDEPVLIASRCDCPVVICSDRLAASSYIEQHFDIDVIICDDGLQHYRLQRDLEIVIVDAQRQFGNGCLLPLGPLREVIGRLKTVDHVIYNGEPVNPQYPPTSHFVLECGNAINIVTGNPVDFTSLSTQTRIHGVCGIGYPQRFHHTLSEYLGQYQLNCDSLVDFNDHHPFKSTDFEQFAQDQVFMTEKDAVKCQSFAQANWHYLPVNAKLPEVFAESLLVEIRAIITHSNKLNATANPIK